MFKLLKSGAIRSKSGEGYFVLKGEYYDAMLRFGIPLSAKIAAEEIHGKKVFTVADGLLMATFDKDLNEEVITEIAKRKPIRFMMCDGGFATDNVADNFEQIWQAFSPDTNRKVI